MSAVVPTTTTPTTTTDVIDVETPTYWNSLEEGKMEFHEAANLFPLLEGSGFDALVADIKANGLREPIRYFGGKILDGRNRYRACEKADIEPKFEYVYETDDPIAFVLSANLHRRHLNPSQLAMVAEKVATMRQGARTDLAQSCATSQGEAAKAVGVSRRQVQKAREVVKKATPADVKAVESGTTTINRVLKMVRRPSWVKSAIAARPAGSNPKLSEGRGIMIAVDRELSKAEDAAQALLDLDAADLRTDRMVIVIRVRAIKRAFGVVLTKASS